MHLTQQNAEAVEEHRKENVGTLATHGNKSLVLYCGSLEIVLLCEMTLASKELKTRKSSFTLTESYR